MAKHEHRSRTAEYGHYAHSDTERAKHFSGAGRKHLLASAKREHASGTEKIVSPKKMQREASRITKGMTTRRATTGAVASAPTQGGESHRSRTAYAGARRQAAGAPGSRAIRRVNPAAVHAEVMKSGPESHKSRTIGRNKEVYGRVSKRNFHPQTGKRTPPPNEKKVSRSKMHRELSKSLIAKSMAKRAAKSKGQSLAATGKIASRKGGMCAMPGMVQKNAEDTALDIVASLNGDVQKAHHTALREHRERTQGSTGKLSKHGSEKTKFHGGMHTNKVRVGKGTR